MAADPATDSATDSAAEHPSNSLVSLDCRPARGGVLVTDRERQALMFSSPSRRLRIHRTRSRWIVRSVPGLVVLAAGVIIAGSGCGYLIGPQHREQVRSIAVPVFACSDDRPGLGLRLTEAVHKEIQRRLPYRVVPGGSADSRLIGRVLGAYKDVIGETRNDDPRTLQLQLAVEVTWTDMRTQKVLAQRVVADDSPAVTLMTDASFSPETGQSMATASQQVINRMARQIVDLLEAPW